MQWWGNGGARARVNWFNTNIYNNMNIHTQLFMDILAVGLQ